MTFINFIKFIFLLFGCDVDQKFSQNPRISIILELWMFLQPTMMIIGSIQLWICFILLPNETSALEISSVILDLLFFTKSFIGYLTVMATKQSSIKLIHKIEKTYQKITKNEQTIKDERIVKKVYSLCIKIFISIVVMVLMNLAAGLVKILLAILTNSQPEKLSILSLWLPDFLENSWFFVTIYSSFILMLFGLGNIFVSELIFVTSAYLAASFDKLGDKVKEVIDGTENRSFLETKKKFAECVDFHSELIELADELNRLYGYFNLTFVILISMAFCMIGIMIMISDMMNAMQLVIAFFGNFVELSLFCMIGDLLEQRVSLVIVILNFNIFFYFFYRA